MTDMTKIEQKSFDWTVFFPLAQQFFMALLTLIAGKAREIGITPTQAAKLTNPDFWTGLSNNVAKDIFSQIKATSAEQTDVFQHALELALCDCLHKCKLNINCSFSFDDGENGKKD